MPGQIGPGIPHGAQQPAGDAVALGGREEDRQRGARLERSPAFVGDLLHPIEERLADGAGTGVDQLGHHARIRAPARSS
jgi:hypothetical protein